MTISACSNEQKTNTDVQQKNAQAQNQAAPAAPAIKTYKARIINKYPHDPQAFTQGLIFYKGYLYESTGLKGGSTLRKVELETGKVLKEIKLPAVYFAEGMTIFNNKIYQLTWTNGVCFQYDAETFRETKSFSYFGEGWGLTHDDKSLIMSDGSNILKYMSPDKFEIEKSITILDENNYPVYYLNELEYINGEIWANIWQTDRIARIDPATGKVTGWLDLSELKSYILITQTTDVLNGIAYDKAKDRIFVTGKNWNLLFEIKVEEGK